MKKMTIEEKEQYKNNPNVMIKLADTGEMFCCEKCSSTVFQHPGEDMHEWKCNGCGAIYYSEE